MLRPGIAFLIFFVIISCTQQDPARKADSNISGEKSIPPPAMPLPSATPTGTPTAPSSGTTPSEHELCYLFASSTDTIRLNIMLSGASAIGHLAYRLRGKDASTGEIRGMVQGDILYAQYTFQSEGKNSIREVAFKLTAAEAREGYGELWEFGGRMIFKNRNALKFESNMVMKAVACP